MLGDPICAALTESRPLMPYSSLNGKRGDSQPHPSQFSTCTPLPSPLSSQRCLAVLCSLCLWALWRLRISGCLSPAVLLAQAWMLACCRSAAADPFKHSEPLQTNIMQSKFAAFISKAQRIWDPQSDDVFYIYPDKVQQSRQIPSTLDDAYGDGWLTIETQSPGLYSLIIANQTYENSSLWELEQILFNWSLSEGYNWQ